MPSFVALFPDCVHDIIHACTRLHPLFVTWLIAKCVCGTHTQRMEILLSTCRIMVTVIEWPTSTLLILCTSRSTPDVGWLS